MGPTKCMLSKAWKLASASIRAPLLGNGEGCFFFGAFLSTGIFTSCSGDMEMQCKRLSLSIGVLMGYYKGFRFPVFMRERKSIFGFISWTQRTLRFLVWGPSGNLVKERCSPELILRRLWGIYSPSIKPRCIGTVRIEPKLNNHNKIIKI